MTGRNVLGFALTRPVSYYHYFINPGPLSYKMFLQLQGYGTPRCREMMDFFGVWSNSTKLSSLSSRYDDTDLWKLTFPLWCKQSRRSPVASASKSKYIVCYHFLPFGLEIMILMFFVHAVLLFEHNQSSNILTTISLPLRVIS